MLNSRSKKLDGDQFRVHGSGFFQCLEDRNQIARRYAERIQDSSQLGDCKRLLHLQQCGRSLGDMTWTQGFVWGIGAVG